MSPDESLFTTEIVHLEGAVVVKLGGELDVATAPLLQSRVDGLVSPHLRAVSLDLRNLAFVDVAGVRALLAAKRALTTTGATFRLLSVGDLTRQVIAVLGLDELEEAMAPV